MVVVVVVGCAGATGMTGVTGVTGVTGGNSVDDAEEFGAGIGVEAVVDFGAAEAAAAAPGAVTARCTLPVPSPETGAALPRLMGRLSGSVALEPSGSLLLGVTGTASCDSPTPPAAAARCTATLPATFPPVP